MIRSILWVLIGIVLVIFYLETFQCNEHDGPVNKGNKADQSIYLSLLEYLKQGYNPLALPACDNKTKFHVSMDMWLFQLFDLDEPTQMLSIDVWMEMSWLDCMLTWDPSKYNNITQITLPAEQIYHPSLIWYEALHGNFEEGMFLFPQCIARIRSNGMVQLGTQGLLKSFCRIDIRMFPFDEQKCNLTFASWNSDASVLNLTKKDAGNSKGHSFRDASNGEWEVMGFPAYNSVKSYKMGSDESGNGSLYSQVTFQLSLKRKPKFIKVYLIFPCVLLVWISALTFLLPVECGEKIGLSVTTLLSIIVFLLFVSENIPRTSDGIAILGIFFCSSIALVCLAVLMTAVVLNIYHRSSHYDMPQWIKTVISKPLMCLFCFNLKKFRKDSLLIDLKSANSANKDKENFSFRIPNCNGDRDHWKILSILLDRLFFVIYIVLAILNTLYIYIQESPEGGSYETRPEH